MPLHGLTTSKLILPALLGGPTGAAAPAFQGVLDDYPGATGGFSFRQLKGTATVAVRLRRSSDDAEQDFGFDGSGDFDSAGAATFIGGGSGFIAKWYDQSGNNRHLVQATSANQPTYSATGLNSLPTMDFDGTNDILTSSGIATIGDYFNNTAFNTFQVINYDTQAGAFWYDDQQGYVNFQVSVSRIIVYPAGNAQGSTINASTTYITEALLTASTQVPTLNGTDGTPDASPGTIQAAGLARPLTVADSGTPINGRQSEFLLYDSAPDRAGIRANINAYYTVY